MILLILKNYQLIQVVTDVFKFKGREMPKYEIVNIAGTVIAKNAPKKSVTILATDGSVVTIKYHGNFSYYDKTSKLNGSVVEESWFKKGIN